MLQSHWKLGFHPGVDAAPHFNLEPKWPAWIRPGVWSWVRVKTRRWLHPHVPFPNRPAEASWEPWHAAVSRGSCQVSERSPEYHLATRHLAKYC